MSYTEVFGGGTINPAQRTYLPLTTAVDVQLQWPIEQQVGGENVAADIIDVDATVPGLNVDFDDARIVSEGFTSLFTNVGANTVTIRDSLGGTIISLAPGEAWFIYLTDNSTVDGVWRTFQLGATVSVANASALAGAGLKAIATTLNQRIAPTSTAVTPINWADSNRARFTIWTGGLGVLNLPAPGGVGSDWFSMIRNDGSGDLTVTPPSGTIDQAATLLMAPQTSAIIVTDGVNFYTIGLGTSTAGFFDFVQINVAGSGDFVLSGVQLNRVSYRFIGALTGNRNIVVPNTVQQYWVDNQTTGAFQLFVKTAAQVPGVEVLQNNQIILYCDNTDVINATSSTLTPPITIGQGGTGATNAVNAMANLGVGRLINTAALSGLSGGGDLSADRSFALDITNLFVELTIDPVADTLAVYDDSAGITVQSPIGIILQNVTRLIDGAGNIAISAQGSSNTMVRGIANADASTRALQFGWQDGTLVGLIGWTGASEEMFITNAINNPDGTIEINTTHADAEILLNNRIRISVAAGVAIRGAAANNASINFTDTAYLGRASIGFPTSDILLFAHSLPNGLMRFQGVNAGTITRTMMELNPNDGPHLFNDGVDVARVTLETLGGLEVNNTLTGSGFERVLTESDVPTIVSAVKTATESVVASTVYQNDDHLIGIVLPVGRWGLEGSFQYGTTVAAGGFKFRWTRTGGTFSGAPYQFTYRANTGASPSNADTYFTTMDGVVGALIVTTNTGEGLGFLNGNFRIITSPITLTTQWAQVVASGTTTFIESSFLRFTRTD